MYGKKTRRERRVPLPALCRQCMEAYLPRRVNVLAKASAEGETALFVNGQGQRLSKTSVSRGIGRLAQRTGVKVTLHQFRHTCASQLLAAGARLPHVQQLLGHRTIQTTMRYLHVADQELHRAMARHPIQRVTRTHSADHEA